MQLKDLMEFLLKIVGLIGFAVTVCDLCWVEILKKLLSQQRIPKHCILTG